MGSIDKSLKGILVEILKEYDFYDGPLFKLRPKLRLHSALSYKSPYLYKEDLNREYIRRPALSLLWKYHDS